MTNTMQISLTTLALACAVAWQPPVAQAQGGACAADVKKFCADVKPGEDRVRSCLASHRAELSEPCRKALDAGGFAKPKQRPQRPCAADVERFCKDVHPGEGRVLKCLDAHAAELSAACMAHRAKVAARKPAAQ